MLRPQVPLPNFRIALREMARVILRAAVSSEPSLAIRYLREARDKWQTPEETDALLTGDCEDLVIRYAAWLARLAPISICIARMSRRTNHVFLYHKGEGVIDPSVIHGMRPPKPWKYKRRISMLLSPEMFEKEKDQSTSGIDFGAIADTFTKTVNSPAFTAVAAGVTGVATVAYPPAGLAIGAATVGLKVAAGAIAEARAPAQKAKATKAQKAKAEKMARAVQKLPPEKLVAAAKAHPNAKRLGIENVTAPAVKRGMRALRLVSAARRNAKARRRLEAELALPVATASGVDEDRLALHLAAGASGLLPSAAIPAAPPCDCDTPKRQAVEEEIEEDMEEEDIEEEDPEELDGDDEDEDSDGDDDEDEDG